MVKRIFLNLATYPIVIVLASLGLNEVTIGCTSEEILAIASISCGFIVSFLMTKFKFVHSLQEAVIISLLITSILLVIAIWEWTATRYLGLEVSTAFWPLGAGFTILLGFIFAATNRTS